MRRAWLAVVIAVLASVGLAPGAEAHDGRYCTRAIERAERTADIPRGLLMAVALTETGRRIDGKPTPWPWAINVDGAGTWFPSRRAALARVRELQAAGKRSIDVGCMQINLKWHPDAFRSLETAFEPAANAAYAARFLKDLFRRSRNWIEAAGRYHSFTEAPAREYRRRVQANWDAVLDDDPTFAGVALPDSPGRIAPLAEVTASARGGRLVEFGSTGPLFAAAGALVPLPPAPGGLGGRP